MGKSRRNLRKHLREAKLIQSQCDQQDDCERCKAKKKCQVLKENAIWLDSLQDID